MGFTLKMLVPPFIAFVLMGVVEKGKPVTNTTGTIGVLILLWGFVAFAAVGLYWIGRVWKRATRDSADPYGRR